MWVGGGGGKGGSLQSMVSPLFHFVSMGLIIHQDRNVHTFSIVLPCGELVDKGQCYSPKGE